MLSKNDQVQGLPWQQAQSFPFLRHLEIFSVAVRFLVYLWWDNLVQNYSTKRRHRRAKWLVRQLLKLGPTFIKIGQSLSTRADLLPIEYVQEFSQLQDRVPGFSAEIAILTIETELGKPITDLFEQFESSPLASASLGQVHRAKLFTGEEVVVKVQRPGLQKLFNLDFEVVHQLLRFANWFPSFRKYRLEAIYQEFFGLLFQEIDYINEGKNAERFRENFQDYPQIKAPIVYWEYTTRKILTLEYLPGIKVDDRTALEANGVNLDEVIKLGICSYLKQLLLDGFFQSDPHPGNMAVNLNGDLIFYDFGTMAEVKPVAKDQMIKTFFAVLKKDTDEVVETLVYMGLIEPISDLSSVRRIVRFLLDNFRDKPVDIRAFEQISEEVYLMFKQQPFRLPAQMTFIIKSLTTLDGIARALDPQYNLLAASQPFIQSLTVSDGNRKTLVMTLARQTANLIRNTFTPGSRTERLILRLEERIEQGDLRFRVRSLENERLLKRIYLGVKTLINACLMGFSVLAAIGLLPTPYRELAIIPFSLAGLFGLFFLRSAISLLIQERLDRLAEK
ncbi:ABC-1 domain protein [Gloeothece citriformis PCC 7424]|uniref:ABC-1 domain protein n=1 Tax=Gloeothece citriformis (strain PCC 7424) TaxID=65393 RepID=B7KHI3_GLOC7|nr:AarF/ABC1/UbiB kinase family protein [Gloeothece citriformis]ACK70678.1 ABC-1 domain protein [Gloeothece citriformis PCC 7424]